jgi:FKBP-type peptidyl-prolyl cis-trans isomerase SlpA
VNTIQEGSFLTLHYRLCGPDGEAVVDTFDAQPATLTLGTGQLAGTLERHLLGLPEGAHERFELAPGEAFGPRNPALVQRVRKSALPEEGARQLPVRIGHVVRLPAPNDGGTYSGLVREVGDDWLLIDFNHPLAGQPVLFEVRVIGVL